MFSLIVFPSVGASCLIYPATVFSGFAIRAWHRLARQSPAALPRRQAIAAGAARTGSLLQMGPIQPILARQLALGQPVRQHRGEQLYFCDVARRFSDRFGGLFEVPTGAVGLR